MQMVLSMEKGYQKVLWFHSLNVLILYQVLWPNWTMMWKIQVKYSPKQTIITICSIKQLVTKAEINWALDVVMSKYLLSSSSSKSDLFTIMFLDRE